MSQSYFDRQDSAEGSSKPASSRPHDSQQDGSGEPPISTRPQWKPDAVHILGNPSAASQANLNYLLQNSEIDSGYGGSIAGDSAAGEGMAALQRAGFHPGMMEDRPTPSHTPVVDGEYNPAAENEKRVLASHVHQLYYNQNRVALGRAINRSIETLRDLQQMNTTWPAHYPSVQRPDGPPGQRPTSRPGLQHTQSTIPERELSPEANGGPARPGAPRRAFTTGASEQSADAESSSSQANKPSEPRLLTPQIAQEFSILKLDLKLGALNQAELVHSLEKHSIASLLDGKISQSIKHLLSLRDRIEDTSSKVLVTGDLNAGKSTFCNALLRRKVLPEDQQPCTTIFCEVLDARENGGLEEVHAVHKEQTYNRHDESTYDAFPLKELERIVLENDKYMQAKVYVKDARSVDESLLNNGVVDIALIDAPGLNFDSLKTTAVFARQEEIDVVVFVVSAENHFTLSAKEFIWNAANEKAYIFIVVNRFDNIKDQQRCQRMILEQVAGLSPRTFKESAELVHFVSSNAVPTSGGGGGDDPGDGDDGEGKGKEADKKDKGKDEKKDKGKEREKVRDFEELERSLRQFVLEKRSRSKLAPAKTYLLNILGDLEGLSQVNRDVAQSELDRVSKELDELVPVYDQSLKARTQVAEDIDKTIEETCSEVYRHTRHTLSSTIDKVATEDLGVPYPGLVNAFSYAEDLKAAMLSQISSAVTACETHARSKAVGGVNGIKALGILHLGDEYTEKSFRPEFMFRKKRDVLTRQVHFEVDMFDFVDISSLFQRQEKIAGTGMAMTVVGVVGGRVFGGYGWVDGVVGVARAAGGKNLRQMIVPGIIVAG